jgi:hypothetical protein
LAESFIGILQHFFQAGKLRGVLLLLTSQGKGWRRQKEAKRQKSGNGPQTEAPMGEIVEKHRSDCTFAQRIPEGEIENQGLQE